MVFDARHRNGCTGGILRRLTKGGRLCLLLYKTRIASFHLMCPRQPTVARWNRTTLLAPLSRRPL
jgi:hypothetical protein